MNLLKDAQSILDTKTKLNFFLQFHLFVNVRQFSKTNYIIYSKFENFIYY